MSGEDGVIRRDDEPEAYIPALGNREERAQIILDEAYRRLGRDDA